MNTYQILKVEETKSPDNIIKALKHIPGESVHCVCTSPPYFGLRQYGAEGQMGLENSPKKFVEDMVLVFKEVKRILRSDGTLWLNLGDSFSGNGKGPGSQGSKQKTNRGSGDESIVRSKRLKEKGRWGGGDTYCENLPAKNLMGIPWKVAFALQDDGWILRSDICWTKPNSMPESVTDRPSKSHEYIFLLSKLPRYYYDNIAVKEPGTQNEWANGFRGGSYIQNEAFENSGSAGRKTKGNMRVPTGWATGPGSHGTIHPDGRTKPDKQRGHSRRHAGFNDRWDHMPKEEQQSFGRNLRDVWEIATQPFTDGDHFATFPEKLPLTCIKAGTSEHGCCASCGSPYVRITRKGAANLEWQKKSGSRKDGTYEGKAQKDYLAGKAQVASEVKARILAGMRDNETIGWKPTCQCKASVVPCTVLDPFSGAATTGLVALKLKRNYIGLEINQSYIDMSHKRIEREVGLLLAQRL